MSSAAPNKLPEPPPLPAYGRMLAPPPRRYRLRELGTWELKAGNWKLRDLYPQQLGCVVVQHLAL